MATWAQDETISDILIVGESILNTDNLNSRLLASYPSANIKRLTYGGSQSSVVGLVLSNAYGYAHAGNLIPNSSIETWSCTSVTAAVDTAPCGDQMVKLTAAGASQQRAQISSIVAPAENTLTFSVDICPGTASNWRLTIYNVTKAAGIATIDFPASSIFSGKNRYKVVAPNTGGLLWTAGNELRVMIYPNYATWGAGTLFVSRPKLNAGGLPSRFNATSGTADAVGALAVQELEGTSRLDFDIVVIQTGRNDSTNVSPATHKSILESCIRAAATFSPRILVMGPPPKANAGLTAWEPATDDFLVNGLRDAQIELCTRLGVEYYDAVTAFNAGSVSALMRDQFHPTIITPGSDGLNLYLQAIFTQLDLDKNHTINPSGKPRSVLGGSPTSGWDWVVVTGGTSPNYDMHGIVAGFPSITKISCRQSATVGEKLGFTATGKTLGVVFIADASTTGSMAVSIDDGDAVTINSQIAGLTNYPCGVIVGQDLDDSEHSVEIEVVSGTCRVVGVVGFPYGATISDAGFDFGRFVPFDSTMPPLSLASTAPGSLLEVQEWKSANVTKRQMDAVSR